MESVTASTLRQNIYQLLDRALETGESLVIARKGRSLRIVPDVQVSRLESIAQSTPDSYLNAPADSFLGLDWTSEWQPDSLSDQSPLPRSDQRSE